MIDSPFDLVIVGAGLSALGFLSARGAAEGRTLVVEYSGHSGGPLRFMLEPEILDMAFANVEFMPHTTAVRLSTDQTGSEHALLVRDSAGERRVRARQILLACGGFEVTREHEQVPGSRPTGVGTAVFANQMLDRGILPGRSPVVHGCGGYAMATARRFAKAGAHVRVVPPPGHVLSPDVIEGVNILESGDIVRVFGSPRLEGITVRGLDGEHDIDTDLVVYVIGIIPNTGWLTGSGVQLATNGAIRTDDHGMTNVFGVYATGTVVAPMIDHDESLAMGRRVAAAARTPKVRR